MQALIPSAIPQGSCGLSTVICQLHSNLAPGDNTPVTAYFSFMKIILCSIGKPHEAYIKQGVEDFTKRINNYFTAEWLLISPPKNAASLPETELKKGEARLVLQTVQGDDFLILLDERGKQITSPQFAQLLQQKANESSKRMVFLIGGAYGVEEVLFKRANYVLSLSQMVFPHMLVRLILAEQVYRACTILRNEKYHHM